MTATIEQNGITWMKWALGSMGAIILLLSGLWVNGLNDRIEIIRQDQNRMYSDFSSVRNEQMARTGKLAALEAAITSLERRMAAAESRSDSLKRIP